MKKFLAACLFIGMTNITNANEVGYASYYWRGQKTASGERFNPNAMTAAHKHYPINSIVQVTNLHNNVTVQLRINDRGPYVKGRIIDVSRSAAYQLGFVAKGVTKVRIIKIK